MARGVCRLTCRREHWPQLPSTQIYIPKGHENGLSVAWIAVRGLRFCGGAAATPEAGPLAENEHTRPVESVAVRPPPYASARPGPFCFLHLPPSDPLHLHDDPYKGIRLFKQRNPVHYSV